MARDTLATLIKIRRLACDAAMQQLAAALAEESRASEAVQVAEREIVRERECATDLAADDAHVEAFAAWLPVARRALQRKREALAQHQADTARVRAELAICRTALETVETLRDERRAASETARQKRWDRELEDRPRRRATDAEPR